MPHEARLTLQIGPLLKLRQFKKTIADALQSARSGFEDAILHASAVEAGLEGIVTLDLKEFTGG